MGPNQAAEGDLGGRRGRPAINSRAPQVPVQAHHQTGAGPTESDERFWALAAATSDVVWTADSDGRMRELSRWCGYTGQSPAQARGRGWLEAVHADDRERLARGLSGAREPSSRLDLDLRIRHVDGQYRPVRACCVPLRSAGGGIREWVVSGSELASRAQTINQSRPALRPIVDQVRLAEAIVETMADGVVVFDDRGYILYTNLAFRALLALDARPDYFSLPLPERGRLLDTRDEQGRPLARDEWPPFRVLRGETLAGPGVSDFIMRRLDGRDVRINLSGAPLRDSEGHIVGGVQILRDVTARRQLDQRTRATLSALLEMAETLVSDDAGADGKPSGSVVTVARRLAELTRTVVGCQRVGIVSVDPDTGTLRTVALAAVTPEQEAEWWANWPRGARMSDYLPPTLIALLTAGEVIPIDRTAPPFDRWPNPPRTRTMLLAPMVVTDQLVGSFTLDFGTIGHEFTPDEYALAAGVARLATLVLERERLLREREEARASALALQEANRRMDEFLGIAAHELKTPVTSSGISVQFAAERLAAFVSRPATEGGNLESALAPLQELLDRAVHNLDRLSRLVVDLLDVSRIRAGKLEMRPARCDLAAIMHEAVEEQHQIAPDRSIHVHMPGAGSVPVLADADRIGQVITNFLTNALKYSPADRPVIVRLQIQGRWARVAVRDEGPGLAAEEQERIWERFHRVDGAPVARRTATGLGLGLYIAKTIVDRHHGRLGVRSTPNRGSTFWFSLPTAPPEA